MYQNTLEEHVGKRGYCAFFDVDGTLINTRSVLSFLEYLRGALTLDSPDFRRYYESLEQMLLTNQSREDVNRFYYTIYAGLAVAQVGVLAARWFAAAEQQAGFYNQSALDELSRHRAAGARVVFVTGSFLQLVAPLAKKTGADTKCKGFGNAGFPKIAKHAYGNAVFAMGCLQVFKINLH